VRRLTHPAEGVVDVNPKLSPDGTRVVFERDDADGTGHVAVFSFEGIDFEGIDLTLTGPLLGLR
jgi:hypothetical protein